MKKVYIKKPAKKYLRNRLRNMIALNYNFTSCINALMLNMIKVRQIEANKFRVNF